MKDQKILFSMPGNTLEFPFPLEIHFQMQLKGGGLGKCMQVSNDHKLDIYGPCVGLEVHKSNQIMVRFSPV